MYSGVTHNITTSLVANTYNNFITDAPLVQINDAYVDIVFYIYDTPSTSIPQM